MDRLNATRPARRPSRPGFFRDAGGPVRLCLRPAITPAPAAQEALGRARARAGTPPPARIIRDGAGLCLSLAHYETVPPRDDRGPDINPARVTVTGPHFVTGVKTP